MTGFPRLTPWAIIFRPTGLEVGEGGGGGKP